MKIEQLKESLLPCFTLSLVVSYFGCLGFFQYYGIDISSYLSISDLTIIYAKYAFFSVSFVVLFLAVVVAFFRNLESDFWSKHIYKTRIKRSSIPVLAILFLTIGLVIFSKQARNVVGITSAVAIIIVIIICFLLILYFIFDGATKITAISGRDWVTVLILSSFLFMALPLLIGIISGYCWPGAEQVNVKMDNNLNVTSDGKKLKFIGKTSTYFFIYDTGSKSTTTYPMAKVESFQMIDN